MSLSVPLSLMLMALPSERAGSALVLEWSATEECPGVFEIRSYVDELLIAVADGDVLHAFASVRTRQASYELSLELTRGKLHELHELSSHDCDELGWLAAQLIASSLDPFLFNDDSDPIAVGVRPPLPPIQRPSRRTVPDRGSGLDSSLPPTDSPGPVVDVEPIVLAAVSAVDAADDDGVHRRMPIAGVVSADASANINVFPKLAGGPRLTVGVDIGRARVMTSGSGWFGSGFRSSEDPDVGGELMGWAVELGACGLPGWRKMYFPVCARTGAGQFIGTGVGVLDARVEAQVWAWLGADAAVEWWVLPRLGLLFNIGTAASVLRPAFAIGGTDASFKLPLLFGRAHVGVSGRFGRSLCKRAC